MKFGMYFGSALAILGTAGVTRAVDDASVTAVNGIASTLIEDITSIVTTNLPLIFGIVIIIVGTMIAYRLVRRFVK